MFIWVDIARLRGHLAILHQEVREAQALADYLKSWLVSTEDHEMVDYKSIQEHLQIVEHQLENIKRRIVLLESSADQFSNIDRSGKEQLLDAKDIIDSLRL